MATGQVMPSGQAAKRPSSDKKAWSRLGLDLRINERRRKKPREACHVVIWRSTQKDSLLTHKHKNVPIESLLEDSWKCWCWCCAVLCCAMLCCTVLVARN